MTEQADQVSTNGIVDTKRSKRRQYSEALKRQMVAETQVPGASVSVVARRHDVNANQLFRWRRQYEAGAAGEDRARLVPVTMQPSPARACGSAAWLTAPRSLRCSSGSNDRLAGGHASMAGGGGDRHAQRLRRAGD